MGPGEEPGTKEEGAPGAALQGRRRAWEGQEMVGGSALEEPECRLMETKALKDPPPRLFLY